MLAGLLVLCVSVIGSAFAPNIEVLLVLRVATGLGGGMLPPNAVATLAEVISPEKRAQAVAGLTSINVMAAAISVPMIALIADWGGWRFAFQISGLMLALALFTNWFWFPADNKERVRDFAFLSRFRSLLALPYFQVATVVNVTHRMAFWGMVSFFAAYLIATYEVSLAYVALPLAVAAVGQVTGSYASALVVGSRHRFALLGLATVVGGILGLLFFAVKLGPLGGGCGGNGRIRSPQRGFPDSGRDEYGVFWTIYGHWCRADGIEQPGRWRNGCRSGRAAAGQLRI